MKTKIISLQIENVKRVNALYLEPTDTGLTVIGGKNGAGKTSVLNAIMWALGGAKHTPSNPKTEGAEEDPMIRIELNNGLIVERKGKKSALTVTDPKGLKGGQSLLDSFISQFALNLPAFLNASNKDKAKILLDTLGVAKDIASFDELEKQIYAQRTEVGKIADSKEKHAQELQGYPKAPIVRISMSELIAKQNEIIEYEMRCSKRTSWIAEQERLISNAETQIAELEHQIVRHKTDISNFLEQIEKARSDESLNESPGDRETIERQIQEAEETNKQIDSNLQKLDALAEARKYRKNYENMTREIEDIRKKRMSLLDSAKLPLEGLTVENQELVYNGQKWDCMSSAEQLQVATAIVRQLQPQCGFVLMDKLESMDRDTLTEFGAWLDSQDLQCIATRVSTGEECTIIIEDGKELTHA